MILLLGASGYVGQAFIKELRRWGYPFIPLSRRALDYARFELLLEYVRKVRPEFIINAAAYSGIPNMDVCESDQTETFRANTLLPLVIDRVCRITRIPWGHVSSGCIYSGAKIYENEQMRIERDLNRAEARQLFEAHPERFFGFTELDEPNCSFANPPFSVLSLTRVEAEAALRANRSVYIWRHRMPFNEQDSPCNFLSKLQRYSKIYDHVTSLSSLDDFARACLELLGKSAPFGIYNIANPGAVTTRQVMQMIQRILRPNLTISFWKDDAEFYREGAKAPRSSCILDVSKLLRAGVPMRPVQEALEDALERWQPAPQVQPVSTPEFHVYPGGSRPSVRARSRPPG